MAQEQRVLPHSEDAERAVLGCILWRPQFLNEVAGKLSDRDFYDKGLREIYSSMVDLSRQGKAIDLVTVTNELEQKKTLQVVGGRSFVAELLSDTITTSNFTEYVGVLKEKSVARSTIKTGSEIITAAQSGSMDKRQVLNALELIRENIDGTQRKQKTTGYAEIFQEEQEKRINGPQATYGLVDLDEITNGIRRGQFIVIGGRPGHGKSALSLQIADNVQKAGEKVLYIPLEMTSYETLERLLIQNDIITQPEAISGSIPGIKHAAVKEYLTQLEKNSNLEIYEGLNELDSIINKVRVEKPFLIVIDQLTQVMPGEKTTDNRERYMAVTRRLKRLAIDEDIAVILTSQLNRDATGKDRPGLENLHESDSTGQDADVVININSKEKDGVAKRIKSMELYVAKNRQGQSGVIIPVTFEGERYLFHAAADEPVYTPSKRL